VKAKKKEMKRIQLFKQKHNRFVYRTTRSSAGV
jgi:hypothetical protein